MKGPIRMSTGHMRVVTRALVVLAVFSVSEEGRRVGLDAERGEAGRIVIRLCGFNAVAVACRTQHSWAPITHGWHAEKAVRARTAGEERGVDRWRDSVGAGGKGPRVEGAAGARARRITCRPTGPALRRFSAPPWLSVERS